MKIRVIDDLSPEDVAMLQALYSRSAESVDVHLAKLKGSAKFMDRYYVGYNHKSIADCGSTTIFIEGVSMLAAKAIQNSPMYSGQESSSRYLDFSKGEAVDPINTLESRAILDRWFDFYASSRTRIQAHVAKTHPRREGEDEKTYENAVKARAFDISRGFLPAGSKTQLSWHTNLRQADDQLAWLLLHPLAEVRDIATRIWGELMTKYASTTALNAAVSGVTGNREAREAWMRAEAIHAAYPATGIDRLSTSLSSTVWKIPPNAKTRPRGCVLPHYYDDLGQIRAAFPLDFGSFRDLQRHRKGVIRMPILTDELGFHPWYLEQLDPESRIEAAGLIERQRMACAGLFDATLANPIEMQAYLPLGYRVPCEVTMGLSGFVYFLELRSSKTVHPTLRNIVRALIPLFREHHSEYDLALHVDMSPDDWTIRRGAQTIEAKS